MYPHERSLVERMANLPFALLGVNTDDSLDAARQAIKTERLNWRSWYDGSTDGPITRQWKVSSFPSIFIIDHKGVVRYYNLSGKELDTAVDELVKEAEAKKSS